VVDVVVARDLSEDWVRNVASLEDSLVQVEFLSLLPKLVYKAPVGQLHVPNVISHFFGIADGAPPVFG